MRAHVEVTAQEVHVLSIRNNARTKLAMNKDDKHNAAWRLVCSGGHSKRDQSTISGVSERTVATMRKTLLAIKEKKSMMTHERLSGLTWEDAKALDRDGEVPDHSEDWVEQEARVWARRLKNVFGNKLTTCPEVFARAIEMYSKTLPATLVQSYAWSDEMTNVIDMLDREADDFEEDDEQTVTNDDF